MRTLTTYGLLLAVKSLSRVFFDHDMRFVGEVPGDPWAGLRLVVILNHTSLYEPVFAGGAPNGFLWEVAKHGVVPVAEKTARRPLVGAFFRLVARHVVSITGERDHTWAAVLARIDDPRSLVVIAPEGRMRRRSGLDAQGNPMTIRGGIADILEALPDGRMLLAYSLGLHHVQAPGERLPRPFRTVRMRLETVDLPAYREARLAEGDEGDFKQAVIRDLTARRDRHCFAAAPLPDPAS